MSALLALENVEARYGPVQALRGISLEVPEGAVVAVLGANGAGKTTTLRAVSGTVRRTGRIEFGGKSLRGGPEAVARAGIVHVPEGRGTFTELTVTENLKLGAYTRRERNLRADIDRVSQWFPWLPDRANQPAGTLSGGEQQMLAVARALMARPRLLMLDEPSLGLAPMIVREIFRIVRELNEKEGLTVLVVEQDARIALQSASSALRPRGREGGGRGLERRAPRERVRATELPRLLMADFWQQVVAGLASGSIYASLALALVLIHRATGVINFAQGEMATFSTYIAWALTTNHGWSYWPAFAVTLLASFAGGVAIHQGIIRPNEKGSVLRVVIVTIGLLLALNGLVTWIWSGEVRAMQSPFPTRTMDIAGVAISIQDIGTIGVVLATVAVLWALFQYTKVGLAMRAAAVNPAEARLVGVRVTWMLSLGWGLAAVLGAISGMLAAPSLFLDPNLMAALLIYAFAAAVLGGIDSPIGAVVGGLTLGVGLNLIGAYVDFVGADLRLPAALAVILVVLLVKPSGIFGKSEVRRV